MQFFVGQEFEHAGVRYRVLAGNRCAGDLVIEFTVSGWYRPTISHLLILANFKAQVEENNYGPKGEIKVAQGLWKLLDAIKGAMLYGWEAGAVKIVCEREAMRQRVGQGSLF